MGSRQDKTNANPKGFSSHFKDKTRQTQTAEPVFKTRQMQSRLFEALCLQLPVLAHASLCLPHCIFVFVFVSYFYVAQ